jgi:hypothetical protein
MSLRCRPGDLAVIVRTSVAPEHIGKIIRCVRTYGEYWQIEPRLPCGDRVGHYEMAHDSCLRPLRDNPGEDQIIAIARKNAHDAAITEQQERLTRLLEEVPKQ